jgi:methyl-accepting chemotaxis protein
MTEQAQNSREITTAADDLRQQAAQAARAMQEQAKAIKDINGGSAEVAKQIKLITKANLDHSSRGVTVQQKIRQIADVSAATTKEAKSIASMLAGVEESANPAKEPSVPKTRSRRSAKPVSEAPPEAGL